MQDPTRGYLYSSANVNYKIQVGDTDLFGLRFPNSGRLLSKSFLTLRKINIFYELYN